VVVVEAFAALVFLREDLGVVEPETEPVLDMMRHIMVVGVGREAETVQIQMVVLDSRDLLSWSTKSEINVAHK
jgi:hypothetical protein